MTTAGNPEHTLPIQFQHCYILTLQANGKSADNISQNFEHHKYINFGQFLSNTYLYVGRILRLVAFDGYYTSADRQPSTGQVNLWKILNLVGKSFTRVEQFFCFRRNQICFHKCSKVLSLFLLSLLQIVVQATHSEVQSAGNGSHTTLKL